MLSRKVVVVFLTIVVVTLLSTVFLTGCFPEDPEIPEDPEDPPKQVKLAADHDFIEGEGGLAALGQRYDIQFDVVYAMAIGLTHEALRAEDVDVAKGYATDGKIKELDLISLQDDKAFFPAHNPAPVVREEALEQYPELGHIMPEIASRLDTDTMLYLNYLVDIEEREPYEVAMVWLLEEGLISEDPPDPNYASSVIIGSMDFTEQRILRQITDIALEYAGIPVEDSISLGRMDVNRNALIKGNIDMYWEYTGIAWNTIFEEEEVITDSDLVHQLVAARDAEEGLIWLDYAPANITPTIMMRREHANELGITSISQLAQWIKQVQERE